MCIRYSFSIFGWWVPFRIPEGLRARRVDAVGNDGTAASGYLQWISAMAHGVCLPTGSQPPWPNSAPVPLDSLYPAALWCCLHPARQSHKQYLASHYQQSRIDPKYMPLYIRTATFNNFRSEKIIKNKIKSAMKTTRKIKPEGLYRERLRINYLFVVGSSLKDLPILPPRPLPPSNKHCIPGEKFSDG